jgi:glyoxylase-like metal-dependent hydrolase (beta-lactamase superfamily II)
MRDDGTPNFPNATLYISQEEIDFWQSNPPGERRERSIAGVRKHLLPLRDRMRFMRDGEEFLPGVQAWLTPGHTPGHMAFLFAGGWLRIPMHRGHLLRFDRGQATDLMAATIPI